MHITIYNHFYLCGYSSHILSLLLGQRACVGRDLPAHPTGLCSMAHIAYDARISGQ